MQHFWKMPRCNMNSREPDNLPSKYIQDDIFRFHVQFEMNMWLTWNTYWISISIKTKIWKWKQALINISIENEIWKWELLLIPVTTQPYHIRIWISTPLGPTSTNCFMVFYPTVCTIPTSIYTWLPTACCGWFWRFIRMTKFILWTILIWLALCCWIEFNFTVETSEASRTPCNINFNLKYSILLSTT